MGKPVVVLVDADPLVYRVGFSLETRVWYVEYVDVDPEHPDDPTYDEVHVAKFYNAASRDEFIRLMNLHPDEYAAQMVSVPAGEERIVYGRVKQTLLDIEAHVAEYLYLHDQEIGEFRLFLTGKDNFRDELATIWEYKGNRDRSLRPYWYKEIRQYLIDRWGAEVVDGMEADDAVAILQWNADEEGGTIICTIDKDLENVPGHFYNYHRKEAKYIDFEMAMLTFYRQVLTGDSSDNIPGCFKVGKAMAAKVLPEYTDEKVMWERIVDTYADNMEKYPEHHAPHTDPAAAALENARLVWMLSKEGELWQPPE